MEIITRFSCYTAAITDYMTPSKGFLLKRGEEESPFPIPSHSSNRNKLITFSMQQRWVQQFHHVFSFSIQLQRITLGQHICQHRQEVVSSKQPPWVKENTGSDRQITPFCQFRCLKGKCYFAAFTDRVCITLEPLVTDVQQREHHRTLGGQRPASSCTSNEHKLDDADLEARKGI